MSSVFDDLCKKDLVKDYPYHLKNNVHYECITGSTAYGVSEDRSDMDVYGFSIPPKHIVFPYSYGNIVGFGKPPEVFEQFQKHHIKDTVVNKEYDINIFNIVRFFQLTMECNPNMVDTLFVPVHCVLHSTQVGNHVRDNRKLFLSKLAWHKFKGYAFGQLSKMSNKQNKIFCQYCDKYNWSLDITFEEIKEDIRIDPKDYNYFKNLLDDINQGGLRSKRLPSILKYGYDVKFGYHVVRLLDECEQILETGDLDLTRSKDFMKAIRRGEVTEQAINDYFDSKLKSLELSHGRSSLRYGPDEEGIKKLLMECLEMHYGNLSNEVTMEKNIVTYISNAFTELEKAIKHLK